MLQDRENNNRKITLNYPQGTLYGVDQRMALTRHLNEQTYYFWH